MACCAKLYTMRQYVILSPEPADALPSRVAYLQGWHKLSIGVLQRIYSVETM